MLKINLEKTVAKLYAIRKKHGFDSDAGRASSNLTEILPTLHKATDPVQVGYLEASATRQWAALNRTLASVAVSRGNLG